MNIDELVKIVGNELKEDAKLNYLYSITLVFDVKSCIRIGTGGAKREAFLPVLKISYGEKYCPVIPESSWRGALRKIGEIVAKSSIKQPKDFKEKILLSHYEPEEGPIEHLIVKQIKEENEKNIEKLAEYDIVERFVPTREEAKNALEPMITYLCPICRLWGGPGTRSRIILEDTILQEYKPYTRTHVGINRSTRTREEGQLYTPEYVYIKQLTLHLTVYNIKPKTIEAKILAGTLNWLTKLGLSIGSSKSRGVGHLTLNNEKSHAYIAEFNNITSPHKLIQTIVDITSTCEKIPLNKLIDYLK